MEYNDGLMSRWHSAHNSTRDGDGGYNLNKPLTIGMVINLVFDKSNEEERALKSSIHHMLGSEWPLHECPILAEFLEYLKGESHFFASVVMLENKTADKTLEYLEQARQSGSLSAMAEASMELTASRVGLVELGVVRKKLPRSKLLQPENIDVDKLREMARTIATECGVPPSAPFTDVNPVQLFDFSSLARCDLPLKLLRRDGVVSDGSVAEAKAAAAEAGTAIVCPIGDALWEPLWTSGLGINRGFHTALNAVHAAALAHTAGVPAACGMMEATWKKMLSMSWPAGLAQASSGGLIQSGAKWTSDPNSRLV